MVRMLLLSICGFIFSTAATSASRTPTFVFDFNPEDAGGVSGAITVTYASSKSTVAKISADLDFSDVDFAKIRDLNPSCPSRVTRFDWHIHVKWTSRKTAQSFAQCDFPSTGNHYDPLFACGPSSEFAHTATCEKRVHYYDCTPERYKMDPLVCEKGDLSGKFGALVLDADNRATGEWVDRHFPSLMEFSPQWNIVLHAVCGEQTPHIACAVVQKLNE